MQFVSIPSGACWIGSSAQEVEACVARWADHLVCAYGRDAFTRWILKEYPKHQVRIAAFQMGRFPVTNADYQRFVEAALGELPESIRRGEPGNCPVWGVSFQECCRFAQWMSRQLRMTCRLPTEHEWEVRSTRSGGPGVPVWRSVRSIEMQHLRVGHRAYDTG